MSDVKEINLETGDEIVREYTDAEIDQLELDAENAQAEAQRKAAAIAKLEKLGLSISDLEALGLV